MGSGALPHSGWLRTLQYAGYLLRCTAWYWCEDNRSSCCSFWYTLCRTPDRPGMSGDPCNRSVAAGRAVRDLLRHRLPARVLRSGEDNGIRFLHRFSGSPTAFHHCLEEVEVPLRQISSGEWRPLPGSTDLREDLLRDTVPAFDESWQKGVLCTHRHNRVSTEASVQIAQAVCCHHPGEEGSRRVLRALPATGPGSETRSCEKDLQEVVVCLAP